MILDAIDRGMYEGGPTGRHWTLDPIDGTKGFLRNEQYAVALALIENGKVVLGHLSKPLTDAKTEFPDGAAVLLEMTPYDFDQARILGKSGQTP